MIDNTLTLATAGSTLDKIYAQPTRSKYSDETRALMNPITLEIAHGTSKDGTVSTVIIINDDKLVVGRETEGPKRIKVQTKVMYDPTGGRDDVSSTITNLTADIAAIIGEQLASLLNKEV